MKFEFKSFPADLALCIVFSLALVPLVALDVSGAARIALGLPFVLFIPGYLLIFALFPEAPDKIDDAKSIGKTRGDACAEIKQCVGKSHKVVAAADGGGGKTKNKPNSVAGGTVGKSKHKTVAAAEDDGETQKKKGIDTIERIALSFGLSIAVVPLIGLMLNYTPWGIRLTPILVSLLIFNALMVAIGLFRWLRLPADKRLVIRFEIKKPVMPKSKLDAALTVILVIAILASVVTLVYVIATPKQGEKFTEFYILGTGGKADLYPCELVLVNGSVANVGYRNSTANAVDYVDENAARHFIGIANHEYRHVNYTIMTWLVNSSLEWNETLEKNETVIHHAYFIDMLQVGLNHTDVNIGDDINATWNKQWETNHTISANRTGTWKVWFLLFDNFDATPPDAAADGDYAGTEFDSWLRDAIDHKVRWPMSLNLNIRIYEK